MEPERPVATLAAVSAGDTPRAYEGGGVFPGEVGWGGGAGDTSELIQQGVISDVTESGY